MQPLRITPGLLLIAVFTTRVHGQFSTALPSLTYPRSVASSAMGEQGVAFRGGAEALQYNPANIAYTHQTGLSYFRNPWNILGMGFPLSSVSLAGGLGEGRGVGLEYTYWDLGEGVFSSPSSPNREIRVHSFERSLAGAYGMSVTDEIAVGAELRYTWESMAFVNPVHNLLVSAGVTYVPAALSDRLTAGISLMNFGTTVDFASEATEGGPAEVIGSDPVPSQIHLGIVASAVSDPSFDVRIGLGATKPIDKRGGPPDYAAQSSFKSLFNDWSDAPRDMKVQAGLGYVWNPIALGGGVSFLQEIYLGYFSAGPREFYDSFYTHGFKVGLESFGIRMTAGYAGRWHNGNPGSYVPWVFPWESFQFGLSTDMNFDGKRSSAVNTAQAPHGIILSAGYAYGLVVGRLKETATDLGKVSFSNNSFYLVEADFYISEDAALLSAIHYSRMTESYRTSRVLYPVAAPIGLDIGIETVSLESGFRYHPVEEFHPLFVQASLGIIRMNPVYDLTYPKYFYKTFDKLEVGGVFPVLDTGLRVMPRIGLTTIFMQDFLNANRLVGYSQWEFAVNAGYAF